MVDIRAATDGSDMAEAVTVAMATTATNAARGGVRTKPPIG